MDLSDGVLLDLEVDAADVHPAHQNDGLVALDGPGLKLLVGDGLLDQHLQELEIYNKPVLATIDNTMQARVI